MLNKQLYNALCQVYGQVLVSNRGMAARVIIPNDLPPLGEDTIYLPAKNTKGGEQYQLNCPFCKDKRRRLNVSYLCGSRITFNGVFYKASDGLAVCFNENCLSKGANMSLFANSVLPLVAGQPDVVVEIGDDVCTPDTPELANQVPFPTDYRPLDKETTPPYILNYLLKERGMELAALQADRIGYAKVSFYRDPALIIPVYQYNHYWFYQARQILPPGAQPDLFDDGREKPKYWIPNGSHKSWALYNLDKASKRRQVVVAEGVTDVWKIGDWGVAKFGRPLSLTQQTVLQGCCAGAEIILLPDMNDPLAEESAETDLMSLQLAGVFKKVRIVKLQPGTDPGMYTREAIWRHIRT